VPVLPSSAVGGTPYCALVGTGALILLATACCGGGAAEVPPPIEPPPATTRPPPLPLTYAEFMTQDFATFFHLGETSHIGEDGGYVAHTLTPPAYSRFITVFVEADRNDHIVSAELTLTRLWVGKEGSMNPDALDIGASFLSAFRPEVDKDRVMAFDQHLRIVQGTSRRVFSLGPPPHLDPPTPEVSAFISTFCGSAPSFSAKLTAVEFAAENRADDTLHITMRGIAPGT
jgi:hypothetical protein